MTELGLHNLKLNKAGRRKSKRLGRGNASGRGTYSGKGLKGQKARSGGKGGLKRKGLMQSLRSKPKMGGFKSLQGKMVNVDLTDLDKNFENGELINPKKIAAKFNLRTVKPGIKILGSGKITKKLTIHANAFSETAKQAIMEAGGKAELIIKPKKVKFEKSRGKKA